MNWNKTFDKIENHFGFKLYDWQKDYISMKNDQIPVGGRCNGKTFAYILRHLLNYEVKFADYNYSFKTAEIHGAYWLVFPCDEFHPGDYMTHWYPNFVKDLNEQLKSIGLDTCFF